MNYGSLTTPELLRFAEADPRYETDPLFTELAERLAGNCVPYWKTARLGEARAINKPLRVDAHVRR